MKDLKIIFTLLILILLLPVPPGLSQPAQPSAQETGRTLAEESTNGGVEVEKWEFGIVTDRSGPTKGWRLHPVVVIPNLPGIKYAWKLKIKPQNPVFVREEFSLPEAPSSWKINQNETSSQLLNGGQQCVLESFTVTDDGWIGHSWTASRGDPAGQYQIKIWLNGKLAHIFIFNVGEPQILDKERRDI